jgi:hypothetical protein
MNTDFTEANEGNKEEGTSEFPQVEQTFKRGSKARQGRNQKVPNHG